MPSLSFNLPQCYLLWLTVCAHSPFALLRLTVLKSNLSLGQIIHKGTDVHTPLFLIDYCRLVKSSSPIVMLCVFHSLDLMQIFTIPPLMRYFFLCRLILTGQSGVVTDVYQIQQKMEEKEKNPEQVGLSFFF